MLHYLSYVPVTGTDWYMTTTTEYDFITRNVDAIQSTLLPAAASRSC